MPEKDISLWQLLAAVGSTLTASLWVFLGVRKEDAKKLDELDDELQDFKQYIMKDYPSKTDMQACSDAITKSVKDGFDNHADKMKLVIHEAVDMATERRHK